MAKRKSRIPLNVFLNGRLVGRLSRETSGAIEFRYDSSWLEWQHAMPVSLSLPLRETKFSGEPVIAVFDNLLPDNDAIRRRLAERSHAEGYDAYSLLSAVGRDCVGALQFLPDGIAPDAVGSISGREVNEGEIAKILSGLGSNPLGLTDDEEFRISLAGAQEKTALLFHKDKWFVPHGTTPTTHILKPAIGKLSNGMDLSDSVENEHACMQICATLGLPTAKTEIHEFGGKKVLVVERFDRIWTEDGRLLRRPQEDMCQALGIPPTRKYESDGGAGIKQVMELLKASDTPEKDRRMFLKAQIVFWLLGATDGHAKNFSIFLTSAGRFRLAPLYDVMSTQPYLDAGQLQRKNMKMAMAIGDKRRYRVDEILPRHFEQTALLCGSSNQVIQRIFEEIRETAGSVEGTTRLHDAFNKRLAKTH